MLSSASGRRNMTRPEWHRRGIQYPHNGARASTDQLPFLHSLQSQAKPVGGQPILSSRLFLYPILQVSRTTEPHLFGVGFAAFGWSLFHGRI